MSGLGVRNVHVPGAAWKVPVNAKIGGNPRPAPATARAVSGATKGAGKGPFKRPPAMPPVKGPGKAGPVPSSKPIKPSKPVSGPIKKKAGK